MNVLIYLVKLFGCITGIVIALYNSFYAEDILLSTLSEGLLIVACLYLLHLNQEPITK